MARSEGGRERGLPRGWPRLCRKVLRRCGGRCEWMLPGVGVRCQRTATIVDHVKPGDDHSMANLRGLCAGHDAAVQAGRAYVSQYIAIRVRPSADGS